MNNITNTTTMAKVMEDNLRIRELIKNIIQEADDCKADLRASFFGENEYTFARIISRLSGVPMGSVPRPSNLFGGTGIHEMSMNTKYKYPNCKEVYISLLYPTITLNDFGDRQFGKYSVNDFMYALIHTRQTAKKMFPDSNISAVIKCMINYMYGFIIRSELDWADEYAKHVPARGRELITELVLKIADTPKVHPIWVNTDCVIVSSISEEVELPDLTNCLEGYKVYVENMHDVVLIDKIRYVEGGKARGYVTAYKEDRMLRSTQHLIKQVIGAL